MNIIHMETEKLHQLANHLRLAANGISDHYDLLNNRIKKLSKDWSGGSAERFFSKTNQRLSSIFNAADQLDALRMRLEHEIEQWSETDNQYGIFRNTQYQKPLPLPENFKQATDRIIRHVEGDGENFILNGLKTSMERKTIKGDNFYGSYSDFELQYKESGLSLSYEESLELYALWEQGKLPKGWPNVKDPFVDFKGKIYEHDFGNAQAAVFAGQAGSENLGYDYSVLSAEATGSASIDYGDGSFKGGLEGQAGVYLGKISANAATDIPLGPATLGLAAAGTAYVGAQVAGEAKFAFDPKNGEVGGKFGGEAFAGGKIEGEVEAGIGYGGVEGKIKGNASLNYGIGVQADVDIGFNQGTIKTDIEFGATLGLGFDLGVSFEFDVTGLVDNITNAGQTALDYLV